MSWQEGGEALGHFSNSEKTLDKTLIAADLFFLSSLKLVAFNIMRFDGTFAGRLSALTGEASPGRVLMNPPARDADSLRFGSI